MALGIAVWIRHGGVNVLPRVPPITALHKVSMGWVSGNPEFGFSTVASMKSSMYCPSLALWREGREWQDPKDNAGNAPHARRSCKLAWRSGVLHTWFLKIQAPRSASTLRPAQHSTAQRRVLTLTKSKRQPSKPMDWRSQRSHSMRSLRTRSCTGWGMKVYSGVYSGAEGLLSCRSHRAAHHRAV